MTATVSADLTLRQFQQKLAEHAQWLPVDGDPDQSIGTLVASNSTGPLRLGYGAWRDLLLGVQFLNGRGELITAGGRTVKNVAGYDLTKFMVGQFGIFGRLVTITTRTYRRPIGALLARHGPDVRILSRLIPTALRPQWIVLVRDALLCGYLGDEPTLEFYRNSIAKLEPVELKDQSLQDDMDERTRLWSHDGTMVFRASVPPARLAEFVAKLGDSNWAADAAFGIALGSLAGEKAVADLRDAAESVQGRVRFTRGLYGPPLEFSTNGAERRIIERLKQSFDPDNKLDPLPWRQN